MALLEELCQLADRYKDASEKERMILKMAICLLDNLEDPYSDRPRKVMFTVDELYRVPGRWELSKGQLRDY